MASLYFATLLKDAGCSSNAARIAELFGSELGSGARLLAIADVYEAITADRPYRAGSTPEQALKIIARHGGTALDTGMIEAAAALALDGTFERGADAWEAAFAGTL